MQHALISKYAQIYRQELLNRVIPFWEKYSRDREFGGYFTCLEHDGAVVDTDKFMWLQGRQVWMFSYLYNELEARPGWLEMAQCGADFMRQYGRDEAGDWYFSLERTGKTAGRGLQYFFGLFCRPGHVGVRICRATVLGAGTCLADLPPDSGAPRKSERSF